MDTNKIIDRTVLLEAEILVEFTNGGWTSTFKTPAARKKWFKKNFGFADNKKTDDYKILPN